MPFRPQLSLQCPVFEAALCHAASTVFIPVQLVIRGNAGESFNIAIKLCQIIGKQFILKQQTRFCYRASNPLMKLRLLR